MVRQQFGMEYFVEDRCFQFDTSWRDSSITLEYERMTAQQWTLTKEGTCRQVGVHACMHISLSKIGGHMKDI